MAATAQVDELAQNTVRIVSVEVPPAFRSTQDNSFWANVTTESQYATDATMQVVFKGYVRNDKDIIYEFLHEQCYIHLSAAGQTTQKVELDVRIHRLPPTMVVKDKIRIEYMCQVNSSAWYNNAHVQKVFIVLRDDVSKERPTFPTRYNINECVGHNQCCHRKCEAMNGKFWIDKIIYTPEEIVAVKWKLNSKTELKEAEMKVIKSTILRYPNPDHPMSLSNSEIVVASNKMQLNEQSQSVAVKLPSGLPSVHKRTIWDTSKLNYFISFKLKIAKIKTPLELSFPIAIQTQATEMTERMNATMTEMEYDMFNVRELQQANKQQSTMTPQRITVTAIRLKTNSNHTLEGATAEIDLTAYLTQHYVVHFLLQGSVCVGGRWYEFLRFKTTIIKQELEVGPFSTTVELPYDRSEYMTPILPPSFNNEIRYEIILTTKKWAENRLLARKIVLVDRQTETLCKPEMLNEYYEEMGAIKLYMKQRAFTRGKFIILQFEGKISAVHICLVQHKRIRRPGLNIEGCWFKERIVCEISSSKNRNDWPREWALQIPSRLTPSMEMCYWNILVVDYKVVVTLDGHDGHGHSYVIPIWIGTTDDELDPPSTELLDVLEPEQDAGEISRNPIKVAPEFEVIPDETDQPWWVDRLDFDVYQPAINHDKQQQPPQPKQATRYDQEFNSFDKTKQ